MTVKLYRPFFIKYIYTSRAADIAALFCRTLMIDFFGVFHFLCYDRSVHNEIETGGDFVWAKFII